MKSGKDNLALDGMSELQALRLHAGQALNLCILNAFA